MATAGKTTIGGSLFARDSDVLEVQLITLPIDASVSKLTFYLAKNNAGVFGYTFKAVIYAKSGANPGALLATGTEVGFDNGSFVDGWQDFPFASPVPLVADDYYIGLINDNVGNDYLDFAYDGSGGTRHYKVSGIFYPTLPDPFGTPGGSDSVATSLYATYASTAPPPPYANVAITI